jgi:prevent-host-death family protein
MTTVFDISEAKLNLSELVDRAAAGEEIVIAKAGKPKAKLVPYEAPRKKRRGGQNLLGITYMADDWDGPLPPEIQKYFDGEGRPFRPVMIPSTSPLAVIAHTPSAPARRGPRPQAQQVAVRSRPAPDPVLVDGSRRAPGRI